jgi:predicted dehydrogenase
MVMAIEGKETQATKARIRLGMVGGGQGAFIGAVHRIAARMDDRYSLVAGALSSDPERALTSAAELGLHPKRAYTDFNAMASRERRLADGIEAVAIVTPNHLHFPVAKAFIRAGIHVICDKPLVHKSSEARQLQALVDKHKVIFAVTYNYTGYPMVRQARELIAAGELGEIRVVQVEYPQDWLTDKLEDSGQKQAVWRTDPARSGSGGCVGDIGTHAHHLAGFVTGLELAELCADLSTFVDGRALDDNVQILLRYHGGARGMLWASQVAPGNENALRLRVYGTKGGLEWRQEDPNYLQWTPFGQPRRLVTRAGSGSSAVAGRVTRVPPGHPEGYLEGFANIYTEVAAAIRARREGKNPEADVAFPTLDDGARGVAFIEAAVRSSARGAKWVKV